MNFGISTGCFYPEKTYDALLKAAKMGVKYTEIFFNTHSELSDEYLEKLKEIIDEYKINVVSVHPYTSAIESFLFFSRDDYKLEDSIKMYENYFKACNVLNSKYVVLHGCFAKYEYMDMQRYCKNLNALSQRAREYDVYISQENVFNYKCGYLENLKEFSKYADNDVKFTFDIKQAVKSRQSIYKILDEVKDRISHIHLSDYKGRTHSMVPFEGSFNYDRFFDYIKKNTSAQAALIEIYSQSLKNDSQLTESLEKLKKYSWDT